MPKPIFNSLGSNYNSSFRRLSKSLLLSPSTKDHSSKDKLTKHLDTSFLGKSQLFYKGRQALTTAIQTIGLKPGDQVLTQAFTCYAVEEGIKAAKTTPVFVDTEVDSLNLSPRTLQTSLNTHPQAKAVLVQHTLGEIAPIKAIANWCQRHHLLLIEDLAHSYGAIDPEGLPVGHHADTVMLSFGRDKMVDAISGGALIVKNLALKLSILPNTPTKNTIIDLLYPSETSLLQHSVTNPLGKLFHKLLKNTPLITNPIQNSTAQPTTLPISHVQLVLHQLETINKQLLHRQKIAHIYRRHLGTNQQVKLFPGKSVYLRFPLIVDSPQKLIHYLKKKQVFIGDTWYRHPVETGSLKLTSDYQAGSCPQAEYLAEHVINLPTHINVSKKDALRITKLINQFYDQN